jgi:hypothetical protein
MIHYVRIGTVLIAFALLMSCESPSVDPRESSPSRTSTDILTTRLLETLEEARQTGDVRLMGRTLVALAEVGDGTAVTLPAMLRRVEDEYVAEEWPIGVGFKGVYGEHTIWRQPNTGFSGLLHSVGKRFLERGFVVGLGGPGEVLKGSLPGSFARNWPFGHSYRFAVAAGKAFIICDGDWHAPIELDMSVEIQRRFGRDNRVD